jgi:hypothetical protein
MNTPSINSFFTEVAALRNSQDSLRIENENLKKELANRPPWSVVDETCTAEYKARKKAADLDQSLTILQAKYDQARKELAQKQESWATAAEYRDQVLELEKLCTEQDQRIDALHTWKKDALRCFQNLSTSQTNEY